MKVNPVALISIQGLQLEHNTANEGGVAVRTADGDILAVTPPPPDNLTSPEAQQYFALTCAARTGHIMAYGTDLSTPTRHRPVLYDKQHKLATYQTPTRQYVYILDREPISTYGTVIHPDGVLIVDGIEHHPEAREDLVQTIPEIYEIGSAA